MTKARTLKDGTVIPARRATVSANRELALLSTIFNKAREWGYTEKTNPCAGVAKNKETPRRYYADDVVWQAVRNCAAIELRDAMDLAYLSGQRPGDVLISSLWKVLLISICYARFVSATMRNSSRCRPVNMRGHHRVAEMIFAYRYTYYRRQS